MAKDYLDINPPHKVDEEHLNPEHLLANYHTLPTDLSEARELLKRELAALLER